MMLQAYIMYNNKGYPQRTIHSTHTRFNQPLIQSTLFPNKTPPKLELRHVFKNNFGVLSVSQLRPSLIREKVYSSRLPSFHIKKMINKVHQLSLDRTSKKRNIQKKETINNKLQVSIDWKNYLSESLPNKQLHGTQQPVHIICKHRQSKSALDGQIEGFKDRQKCVSYINNFIKTRYKRKRMEPKEQPPRYKPMEQKQKWLGPWPRQMQMELPEFSF